MKTCLSVLFLHIDLMFQWSTDLELPKRKRTNLSSVNFAQFMYHTYCTVHCYLCLTMVREGLQHSYLRKHKHSHVACLVIGKQNGLVGMNNSCFGMLFGVVSCMVGTQKCMY